MFKHFNIGAISNYFFVNFYSVFASSKQVGMSEIYIEVIDGFLSMDEIAFTFKRGREKLCKKQTLFNQMNKMNRRNKRYVHIYNLQFKMIINS